MSLEGFQMVRDAFEDVFLGDHAPDFASQSAVIDGAAEAVAGAIRNIEASPEEMVKLAALLAAAGAVILSAVFKGGRWFLRVRFG